MCSPIPITSPLLEDNGHPIPTKTPTPFSKPFYSIFSDHSHLCLPLSSSAMAALFHPRSLRRAALLAGALNLAIIALGTSLFPVSLRRCGGREKSAVAGAVAAAALRIGSMLRAGIAQGHAAVSIATAAAGGRRVEDAGDDSRHRRRRRYRRWLWWTRFGMFVNALQFVMALYLMYIIMKDFARDGGDNVCFLGHQREDTGKKFLMATFLALVWLVVVIQCITGSDVLRWRSFYATQDSAWKVHYSEVFDHGIREALCCLGRVKYLSVLEEDEVFSVARLLGDLVAYRATGTGHLELLAGLALLQSHKQPTKSYNEDMEAPLARIQEARVLHQFAEAAYTGPLLDFGRNTVLFPCSWLYRQGVLTPWTHNRRPILEGDNWWRGHAAAFLKCANLSPQALQRGRVIQKKREAAYFIVVIHDLRSVVIAVRGTETPEDLITDGLCGECILSEEDLNGLINCDQLHPSVRETVVSSFPHYGHSGIVESSRELYMQVDGPPGDMACETSGFLSTLLGPGCECEGYKVRLVGHSLGGAVATLLGLRLKGRYPNLHVYAYGTLPCVDSVIAEACSDFVTTIVYNDEFSSRLSVNSILRLRAAAIQALSADASANSAVITKLAQKILNVRKHLVNGENHSSSSPSSDVNPQTVENGNHLHRRPAKYSIQGGFFLCGLAVSCMTNTPIHQHGSNVITGTPLEPLVSSRETSISDSEVTQPKQEQPVECSTFDDLNSGVLNEADYDYNIGMRRDSVPDELQIKPFYGENINSTSLGVQESLSADYHSQPTEIIELKEMFLPGLIIHIIPEHTNRAPIWTICMPKGVEGAHKAYVANRENFKDIVVSPYMFLDHLPWRCAYAMQKVLETQKPQLQQHDHLISSREDIV
ncbi:uncharacterized protein LOC110112280 [Dendrobium catenatum]|uniref:uncharacterized protein LOC110112280 n=1 Tax=Dendrobium catenatum TaxID=906689 RepID=UPI0009F35277|nr:uncharacterized protein LOC110112280 [Dendrobium catenatum]